MHSSRLSRKFQMVIPKTVRKLMRLDAGMTVVVQPVNEHYALLVKQPKNHVASMRGLGKDMWEELGGGSSYIKQERSSWQNRS